MANNDEYLRLRRMTGEADEAGSVYSNTDLDIFINDAAGDLNLAAAAIWREKAGNVADLVNMSEAGSSRSNSDLYKNAIDQAERYEAAAGAGTYDSTNSSTTRGIVRA